jgi:hypothetical protein
MRKVFGLRVLGNLPVWRGFRGGPRTIDDCPALEASTCQRLQHNIPYWQTYFQTLVGLQPGEIPLRNR